MPAKNPQLQELFYSQKALYVHKVLDVGIHRKTLLDYDLYPVAAGYCHHIII